MATPSSSLIGVRTSQFVPGFLNPGGIQVMAQGMRDTYLRKVYWFWYCSRVLVKMLVRLHNDTLVRREQEYAVRLTEDASIG